MVTGYAFDNAVVQHTSQRFETLQRCYDPASVGGLAHTGVVLPRGRGRRWVDRRVAGRPRG